MLTAIILAGGRGDRMPYGTGPKCLLELRGKTILERQLKWLYHGGVDQAVVCIGNEGDKVAAHVKTIDDWTKTNVMISDDGADSHIAARISRAVVDHDIQQALVLYGDTLADVDINALADTHRIFARAATMTITRVRSEFGIVELGESGRVKGFDEKPLLPYWKNIGFIMLKEMALGYLEGDEGVKAFPDFLEELAGLGHLSYHQHMSRFLTVNTVKDYVLAQEEDWYE